MATNRGNAFEIQITRAAIRDFEKSASLALLVGADARKLGAVMGNYRRAKRRGESFRFEQQKPTNDLFDPRARQ